jgi:hypothetical protein
MPNSDFIVHRIKSKLYHSESELAFAVKEFSNSKKSAIHSELDSALPNFPQKVGNKGGDGGILDIIAGYTVAMLSAK